MKPDNQIARIFFGIPITKEHIDPLITAISDLNPKMESYCRWVTPENCHLTVRFIGSVPRIKIPSIIEVVDQAIEGFSQFSMFVEKVDIFPERRARIIAAYIKLTEPLV